MIDEFAQNSQRVQKMAEALTVDLPQAVMSGKLRHFPIQDIVYRCSRCTAKDACKAWLDTHGATATNAPDYCRNKALLEGLQA